MRSAIDTVRGMTARAPVRRIEIDGAPATVERLSAAAPDGYGHFTAMQVRERRVRGLGLHLARLDAANLELFGIGLDVVKACDHIRHALGAGTRDASVRVASRRIEVDTAGLRSFRAGFVTNSRGIAPVGQIDDLSLPVDDTLLATLTGAYESAGWDRI